MWGLRFFFQEKKKNKPGGKVGGPWFCALRVNRGGTGGLGQSQRCGKQGGAGLKTFSWGVGHY